VSAKKTVPGQRRTSQREAIRAAIDDARGPLTVNEIHDRAQQRVEGLGMATVYRTVRLLLDEDVIHEVLMSDGERRYESAGLGHHHHFRCRRCDHVFDLPGCLLSIPDGTTLPGGYIVDGHELTLFGICPRCTDARKKRR
jgi:Fur family ferric uptake transcriptional regulator